MAKIQWNLPAFEEVRRLPGVDAELRRYVDRALSQLGDGYDGGVEPGRTRSRGYIVTSTIEGIRDNAKNHSIIRVVGSL